MYNQHKKNYWLYKNIFRISCNHNFPKKYIAEILLGLEFFRRIFLWLIFVDSRFWNIFWAFFYDQAQHEKSRHFFCFFDIYFCYFWYFLNIPKEKEPYPINKRPSFVLVHPLYVSKSIDVWNFNTIQSISLIVKHCHGIRTYLVNFSYFFPLIDQELEVIF